MLPWIIALTALVANIIERILRSGRFIGKHEGSAHQIMQTITEFKAEIGSKLAAINGLGEWRRITDRELERLASRDDRDHDKHKAAEQLLREDLTRYIDNVEGRLTKIREADTQACHARMRRIEDDLKDATNGRLPRMHG